MMEFCYDVHSRQRPKLVSLIWPQFRQSERSSAPAVCELGKIFALPSLRRRCVNRVAGESRGSRLTLEPQNDFAIHSAKLATATRHIDAVSESLAANDAINRQ